MKMIIWNSEEDAKNEIEFISMAKQNKMDGIILPVSYVKGYTTTK